MAKGWKAVSEKSVLDARRVARGIYATGINGSGIARR